MPTTRRTKARSGGTDNGDDRLPGKGATGDGEVGDPGLAARNVASNLRAGPWLVLSSLFFLQPITLATCMGVHDGPVGFVSKFCTVISFISIMYWVHPVKSWRLTLDINVARASFFVVLITASIWGEANMHGVRLIAMINGSLIVAFYKLSCYLFELENPIWPFFHALMHLSGGFNMALCCFVMTRSKVPDTFLASCYLSQADSLLLGLNRHFATGPLDEFFKFVAHVFSGPVGFALSRF